MAELLYVRTGELSAGKLKTAVKQVAGASKDTDYGLSCMYAYYLRPDDIHGSVFSASQQESAEDLAVRLYAVENTLQKLKPLLENGPEAFADIDATQKGKLTDWWMRTNYGIHAAAVGAVSFFGAMFYGKGNNATGTKSGLPSYVRNDETESTNYSAENDTDNSVFRVNDYSAGVKRGQIRYVDQNGGYYGRDNLAEYGWGDRVSDSGWECGTACESMALSYMGIDKSPGYILNHRGGFNWGNAASVSAVEDYPIAQRTGYDASALGEMIDEFTKDRGKGDVSPVLIRYSDNHVVMILDRVENEDGSWTCHVLGPSNYGNVQEHDIVTVKVQSNLSIQAVEGGLANIGGGKSTIEQMVQYYRTDGA